MFLGVSTSAKTPSLSKKPAATAGIFAPVISVTFTKYYSENFRSTRQAFKA
jgi:hypothetical protein